MRGVDDCVDFGDGFADVVDLCELRGGTTRDLLHSQSRQFKLQLLELFCEVRFGLGP